MRTCGEDDWRCLERHHLAGRAYDGTTVILCRNCHRKQSDPSDNADAPSDPPTLERIGRFLLGLAALFLMLAAKLKAFGEDLLAGSRVCPRPYGRQAAPGAQHDPVARTATHRHPRLCRADAARQSPPRRKMEQPPPPSAWALVFDIETTIDAAQQLRFGAYQVRQGDDLREAGLFYDPLCLDDAERSTLYGYASDHGFTVRTVEEFIEEVFLPYLFDLRGTCIGLNLPFDLARLAIHHAPARGRTMHGGFSFRLSEDKRRPRIQVKHLTGRAAP